MVATTTGRRRMSAAERRDELIDSISSLDMPRLHNLLARYRVAITAAQIERAIGQTDRTHGEVAGAYVAWLDRHRRRHTRTVARLIRTLAQPPLITLNALEKT